MHFLRVLGNTREPNKYKEKKIVRRKISIVEEGTQYKCVEVLKRATAEKLSV